MKKLRAEGLGYITSSLQIGAMAEVVRGELLQYDLNQHIVALMSLLNESPSFPSPLQLSLYINIPKVYEPCQTQLYCPPITEEKVKYDIVTLTRFLTEEQTKHKEATGDFTHTLPLTT